MGDVEEDEREELLRLQLSLQSILENRGAYDALKRDILEKQRKCMIEEQRVRDSIARLRGESDAAAGRVVDNITEASESFCDPDDNPPAGRFLQKGDPRRGEKIALASYPRSGNSLLRNLMEKLFGITTGSDADPKRTLNVQLVQMGMVGEGVVDDRVWMVKTHFPERLGKFKFSARRAIVIVRNPFDAIVSYFNMIITQSHTHSLIESEYEKYARIWDAFVYDETETWKKFHAQWLMVHVPALFVRYEDLVLRRGRALTQIAEFVTESPHLDADMRMKIEELSKLDSGSAGVYAPRAAFGSTQAEESDAVDVMPGDAYAPLEISGAFLRSLNRFSETQKRYVLSSARDLLHRFGYWDSIPENPFSVQQRIPIGKCVLRHFKSKKGDIYARINAAMPLRPQTEDDPYCRGFGRRWKRELSMLPPPRVTHRHAATNETSDPGIDAHGNLTIDAFVKGCNSWVSMGTPPASVRKSDLDACAFFSDWSWRKVKPTFVDSEAPGYLHRIAVRDGIEFTFHIIYHPVYKVPTLFFAASTLDGIPCGIDVVVDALPSRAQELQRHATVYNAFITRDEHPHGVDGCFFMLHPCQTSLVMQELAASSTFSYLLAWYSFVGPLFGIGMGPEVHKSAKARIFEPASLEFDR